ncbi:hypothetical protein BGW37DRAFT_126403 [Umbelopsis sp. PMI_123]|nr:hypothetical protein BGW37DRAFT_126403 [Umbelopsis sp. PMI_123]
MQVNWIWLTQIHIKISYLQDTWVFQSLALSNLGLVARQLALGFLGCTLDLVRNRDMTLSTFFGLSLIMASFFAGNRVTSSHGMVLIVLLELMFSKTSSSCANGSIAGSVSMTLFMANKASSAST